MRGGVGEMRRKSEEGNSECSNLLRTTHSGVKCCFKAGFVDVNPLPSIHQGHYFPVFSRPPATGFHVGMKVLLGENWLLSGSLG